MYTAECMSVSMCVCVCVREEEQACITCPVRAGVRFASDTACQDASAIDALLCCDGPKKIKKKHFHSYCEWVCGDGVALGDCCHGDKHNCCVA